MKQFRNLIFDIGDVLVDIDYSTTVSEFQKLAGVDFNTILSYSRQHQVFDKFEKGEITAAEFRQQLRHFLKPGVTDREIDNAWNAILIHYPLEKFDLLRSLKEQYRLFALSNINEIHAHSLDLAAKGLLNESSFRNFFHYTFYSHEVGFRKPEPEIYKYVLDMQNLIPEETFFVDDKKENVEAAVALGINAFQLTDRNHLKQLLQSLGI